MSEISKRELALSALFSVLQEGLGDVKILRNEVLNVSVAKNGLLILRDGTPGDPEVILSPVRYIYQHEAALEVFVQNPIPAERETEMDALLYRVGEVLEQNKTLGGKIDFLRAEAPELLTEPVEGAATLKAATVPIFLEYWTDNPLK